MIKSLETVSGVKTNRTRRTRILRIITDLFVHRREVTFKMAASLLNGNRQTKKAMIRIIASPAALLRIQIQEKKLIEHGERGFYG